MRLWIMRFLILGLFFSLAACSGGETSPTLTAQSERSQRMATQAAEKLQATLQVEQAQATATVVALQAILEEARQWPVLISDSFDEDLSTWTTGESQDDLGSSQWTIANQRYEWVMQASQSLVWWSSPDMDKVTDFYLSASLEMLDGPDDALSGLVFRVEKSQHYYLFQIDGAQNASVYAYDQEQGWISLAPWSHIPVLAPSSLNTLSVVAKGADFWFFINDQLVFQIFDDRFSSGTIGVMVGLNQAEDRAHWAFDDFEVRLPVLPATTPDSTTAP